MKCNRCDIILLTFRKKNQLYTTISVPDLSWKCRSVSFRSVRGLRGTWPRNDRCKHSRPSEAQPEQQNKTLRLAVFFKYPPCQWMIAQMIERLLCTRRTRVQIPLRLRMRSLCKCNPYNTHLWTYIAGALATIFMTQAGFDPPEVHISDNLCEHCRTITP